MSLLKLPLAFRARGAKRTVTECLRLGYQFDYFRIPCYSLGN